MVAALTWYQRLPAATVAEIIGRWLDRQGRYDTDPHDVELCGPMRPASRGADWLCELSRDDVRDEAVTASETCWDLVAAGAGWPRMVSVCESRGVEPPARDARDEQSCRSALLRVCCKSWWSRRLRRARALELARREQPQVSRYCSGRARDEYRQALADSAAWAQSAELTRLDSGERWTMAELIAKSVADPGVRAAELITRVRGAGEWADAMGWVGLLVTLTAPGHMHPIKGPGWTGESAREVQAHLSACWARTRAALWRAIPDGDRPVGLRVVEPHRDGTPHWHQIVWLPARHVETFAALLRRYFWAQHSPGERGSAEHRVKVDRLKGGADGAVGYVIKYVIKHLRSAGSSVAVREVAGDHEIPEARTVDTDAVQAWSRQWGLRTWQAIGGPSVTPWRCLRRVEGLGEDGFTAPGALASACAAADSGDWCGYMQACRTHEGGWRGVGCIRSPMRWDTAMQIWHKPMPGRYREPAALVVSDVYGIQSDTGTASTMRVSRFRWGAVARSAAVPLGHVSLTVRAGGLVSNGRAGDEAVGGAGWDRCAGAARADGAIHDGREGARAAGICGGGYGHA